MGYDVTFHPISVEELQNYVFDVLVDHGLVESRVAKLTDKPEYREHLLKFYAEIPEMADETGSLADSLGIICATIAGFLHPYWYARNCGLSFLPTDIVPEVGHVFAPYSHLTKTPIVSGADTSGRALSCNFDASGYIRPESIRQMESLLVALELRPATPLPKVGFLQRLLGKKSPEPAGEFRSVIDEYFNPEGLHSLRLALKYAREKQVGLIEAAEVAIPIAGGSASDPENMRADFLGNAEET